MKKYVLFLLLLVIVLVSCKKIKTGTITGYVWLENPGLKLISSESVRLVLDSTDTIYARPDGYFEFKNLPPGTYDIKISEPNVNFEYGFYGIQVLPSSERILAGVIRMIQRSDVIFTDTAWDQSHLRLKLYFTSDYYDEGDNLNFVIFSTDSTYNYEEAFYSYKEVEVQKDSTGAKYVLYSPFGHYEVVIPYIRTGIYTTPRDKYGNSLEKFYYQATFGEPFKLEIKND